MEFEPETSVRRYESFTVNLDNEKKAAYISLF